MLAATTTDGRLLRVRVWLPGGRNAGAGSGAGEGEGAPLRASLVALARSTAALACLAPHPWLPIVS